MLISKQRKFPVRWMLGLAALLLAGAGYLLLRGGQEVTPTGLSQAAAAVDIRGFARAEGPQEFAFPLDHGPHPDYQTEWWYFTGNLEGQDGRRFGYQLTFFRRALVPPPVRLPRSSEWAADQVYMAHFALTDVAGRRYQAHERLQRGAAGLAGAQAAPFQVWLEDWQLSETEPGVYQLTARSGQTLENDEGNSAQVGLELTLRDLKGPVLQGEQGYSRKGPEPGQASYYYSLTRLESSGWVESNGVRYPVQGYSWMDHEFSTSALSLDQVGWDWFSVQLDNQVELMFFQIRKTGEDGAVLVDPFSSGTVIYPDGSTRHLAVEDFSITVNDTWRSPRSGGAYPSDWTVEIPALQAQFEIEPLLADQELNVSYSYWEGAVQVRGQLNGEPVNGYGYVELTGYSGSMGGEF